MNLVQIQTMKALSSKDDDGCVGDLRNIYNKDTKNGAENYEN
jgi:hypothetical protein